MKFRYRVMFLALGAFILGCGWTLLIKYGVFPFLNHKMQPVYPIGVVIIGVILMALAFLPNDLEVKGDPKSPSVLRIKKFR